MASAPLNWLLKIGSDALQTTAQTICAAINELNANKSSVNVVDRFGNNSSVYGTQIVYAQAIVLNGTYINISGTAYIEKTVTLNASNPTSVVFLENTGRGISIDNNTLVEFAPSKWDLVPDDIVVNGTNHTVTVTLPADPDASTVTVRIYVR